MYRTPLCGGSSWRPVWTALSIHAEGRKVSRSSANSASYSRAKREGSSRRSRSSRSARSDGFMSSDDARQTSKVGIILAEGALEVVMEDARPHVRRTDFHEAR